MQIIEDLEKSLIFTSHITYYLLEYDEIKEFREILCGIAEYITTT